MSMEFEQAVIEAWKQVVKNYRTENLLIYDGKHHQEDKIRAHLYHCLVQKGIEPINIHLERNDIDLSIRDDIFTEIKDLDKELPKKGELEKRIKKLLEMSKGKCTAYVLILLHQDSDKDKKEWITKDIKKFVRTGVKIYINEDCL